MPKIKAIFFDLDDTLINSKTAQYNAICQFRKLFKIFEEVDEEYFSKIWHEITIKLYEEYAKGKMDFQTQRVKRIKNLFEKFNINIDDKLAQKYFEAYLNLYKANWNLFGDTLETLEDMQKKYKLVLITNGDSKQQREKIEKTKIENYFSKIIISSEVGVSKPKKEIFELACKEINIEPENCLMVGDSYRLDIKGAQNAGLKAVWVNRKNENIEYKNQINELKELNNII